MKESLRGRRNKNIQPSQSAAPLRDGKKEPKYVLLTQLAGLAGEERRGEEQTGEQKASSSPSRVIPVCR